MGKTAYNLKNMFKSKEQIELEARMQFNQTKRSFARYYQDLDGSIKNFSRMARDAELNGNHENAKAAAKFVLKLQGRSVFGSPIDVRYGDRLLLLVTCDYTNREGRFILALRQLREDENEGNMFAEALQAEMK